jgi:hypothetical protein
MTATDLRSVAILREGLKPAEAERYAQCNVRQVKQTPRSLRCESGVLYSIKTNQQFNENKTSTARRYLTDSDYDRIPCIAVNRRNQMRDQFMRIAMARIRADYPFRLQRIAVAAKMWSRFVERKQQ